MRVHLHVADELHVHSAVKLKGRHVAPGKPYVEQYIGDDYHRDSDTWNTIHRVIDRANNRYTERILDGEGHVKHEVDEPLDQHRDHGAARKLAPRD